MGLRFNSGSSTEGYMGDGIFVDVAIIKSVVDLSGKTTAFWQRPYSLALEAKIILVKNDWERTFSIGGNFKRDEQTDEVIGWGSAFKVRDFLLNTSTVDQDFELDDNNQIPTEVLESMRGKTFLLLSYRNSRGKTSNWDQIGVAGSDREELKNKFLSEWKRTGYPRNYSAEENKPVPAPTPEVGNEDLL